MPKDARLTCEHQNAAKYDLDSMYNNISIYYCCSFPLSNAVSVFDGDEYRHFYCSPM